MLHNCNHASVPTAILCMIFSLLRGNRHQIEALSHLAWHGESEDTTQPSWILELHQSLFSFQYTSADSQKISARTGKCISMMCVCWRTTVDKDRGFLLPAIFTLCFPMGPRAVSGACTCCTILHSVQYLSSSSEGAQLSLRVQQRRERRSPIQERVIRGHAAAGWARLLLPWSTACSPSRSGERWVKPQPNYYKIFQLTWTLKLTTGAGMACNMLSKPNHFS